MKVRQFAFYGTLRLGMSNFQVYQASLRYRRTVVLPGFDLYDAGAYPYAVRSSQPGACIVVDLMEVIDEHTQKLIDALEFDAGYFLDTVIIDDDKFGIYLYQQNLSSDPLIESGDWKVHCNRLDF